ncbi:MAG: glycosyltransferase family 4 protein [Candidatus Marinimicrobia bacterium]|nr:glycosyltransferase family 4 protein [Candidatus Neomarinimicrobiota bacterium]
MEKSIIYIFSIFSSVIAKDIEMLSQKYTLRLQKFEWQKKYLVPIYFFRQLLFLLKYLPSSKVIFIKFGGYWSFLPSLFGKVYHKPVYILLGGADCVSYPSINYGHLRKPLLKIFIKMSYQLCTKLLPVDQSLVQYTDTYYQECRNRFQGIKNFFPALTTDFQIIHNGFDLQKYPEKNIPKIKNSFVTLAMVGTMSAFYRKGIDKVVLLAEAFPECSFSVIGMSRNIFSQLKNIPDNLKIHEHLPFAEFIGHLHASEFVLQLSIIEGFPNALCEAMLCRCIPVGSAVGAIPLIIDGCGLLIYHSNIDYIRLELNNIILLPENQRRQLATESRNRIIENFSLSKREKTLISLIESNPLPAPTNF